MQAKYRHDILLQKREIFKEKFQALFYILENLYKILFSKEKFIKRQSPIGSTGKFSMIHILYFTYCNNNFNNNLAKKFYHLQVYQQCQVYRYFV